MNHSKTKKQSYKILAVIACVLMLISILCLGIYAEDGEDVVVTEGKCGSDLNWSFSAGTLTITGSGKMDDYSEINTSPWNHLAGEIRSVIMPDGLENIGAFAFFRCNILKTVYVPDGVKLIGLYAFFECESLEMLRLGEGLIKIGANAFSGCIRLASLNIPSTVATIGYQAFYRCESIVSVTIPARVTEIGNAAFAYCKNLVLAKMEANIKKLPEWTFYGCEMLTIVTLPKTLETLEDRAFSNCSSLLSVHYDGSAESQKQIEEDISLDIPDFATTGAIVKGEPSDKTISGKTTENPDGSYTVVTHIIYTSDLVNLVSSVTQNFKDPTFTKGTYSINVTVTADKDCNWDDASKKVSESISEINSIYTGPETELQDVDLKVYLEDDNEINRDFVEKVRDRDLDISVITTNGSEWVIKSSDLKVKNDNANYNYAYTVNKATDDVKSKLETDNCFKIIFSDSAAAKAELKINLSKTNANSNAYLYQVEDDGSLTKIQGTRIDNEGIVHIYLSSVEKETVYMLGVDVPFEDTSDVIIPDELFAGNGAIERLEEIPYPTTGKKSSWGMGFKEVTWILAAVIAVCIVVVGVVMALLNKRKLARLAANGYMQQNEK